MASHLFLISVSTSAIRTITLANAGHHPLHGILRMAHVQPLLRRSLIHPLQCITAGEDAGRETIYLLTTWRIPGGPTAIPRVVFLYPEPHPPFGQCTMHRVSSAIDLDRAGVRDMAVHSVVAALLGLRRLPGFRKVEFYRLSVGIHCGGPVKRRGALDVLRGVAGEEMGGWMVDALAKGLGRDISAEEPRQPTRREKGGRQPKKAAGRKVARSGAPKPKPTGKKEKKPARKPPESKTRPGLSSSIAAPRGKCAAKHPVFWKNLLVAVGLVLSPSAVHTIAQPLFQKPGEPTTDGTEPLGDPCSADDQTAPPAAEPEIGKENHRSWRTAAGALLRVSLISACGVAVGFSFVLALPEAFTMAVWGAMEELLS